MPTCIYCVEEKEVGEFSRKHVIPSALVSGFSGALTLAPPERPYVCKDCNQSFGDTIDRVFNPDPALGP